MRAWTASKRLRGVGQFAVVGAMLALWLATFALTASPQLHHLLHQDAQSVDHHCLITQIKDHPVLAGFGKVVVPVPPLVGLGPACCADVQFLPTFDYRLSPSRAPPSGISSITVVG